MKKLTDEILAKALGWHIEKKERYKGGWINFWAKPGHKKAELYCEDKRSPQYPFPPNFVSAIEVIIEEINRRKLYYLLLKNPYKKECSAVVQNEKSTIGFGEHGISSGHIYDETEALALCGALLTYLEKAKNVNKK